MSFIPDTQASASRAEQGDTRLAAPDTGQAARPVARRALLPLLGALAAFSPLSIDMYLPSLPAIGSDFNADAAGMQATLSLFLFGLAGGQFIYGPLSDRFGRRPPLLAGILIYLAATLGCAVAPSIDALIALRLLQGVGGCAGVVISRAVVTDLFRGGEAARALSLLMLIMGVAPIVAPILGAIVGAEWGWRAVFGVQAAFAAITGACAYLFLPESRSAEVAAHAHGERAVRAYRALLCDVPFLGYVLTAALCNASLLAYVAAIPDLLVNYFDVAPANVGWFFGLSSFVVIGANQVNRTLLLRHRSTRLLHAAVLFPLAPAALLVIVIATGLDSLWVLIPLVLLACAPFAFVQSNAGALGFALQPMRAGSAAAVFGAAGYIAGALSGWSASLAYDGTPMPIAAVMLACLTASAAIYFAIARRRRSTHRATPSDRIAEGT